MHMDTAFAGRGLLGAVLLLVSASATPADDTPARTVELNRIVKDAMTAPAAPCPGPETPTQMWTKAGFTDPVIESWGTTVLYPSGFPGKPTHQVTLTTVLFRNAGWSREEVLKRFRRMGEVYTQCGIRISEVSFVEADAPNGWIDIDYSVEKRDQKISKATPTPDRPVFYFVRSDGEGQLAYSWHPSNGDIEKALFDTAWITADVKAAEKSFYDPSYSVEAHELGHILEDKGHLEDGSKNYLAGRADLVNDKIRPDQCELMKKHPAVHPL